MSSLDPHAGLRPVDHCVLPVADLDIARARYRALGFTVAPDGIHPFGTRNSCIYLADDTFLEPLVVGDQPKADKAARSGNVFVARDRAFRFRNGEGFSALVTGTADAAADHGAFGKAGLSGGRMLRFSRGYKDAAGARSRVSFKLAFAADLRAPDAFFFACERINAPAGDRGALAVHANGAQGIVEIVMVSDEPSAWRDLLETVAGVAAREEGDRTLTLAAHNARLTIMPPKQFLERFGVSAPHGPSLRFAAIVFGVADIAATRAALEAGAVVCQSKGDQLIVPPAPGQGATFAFEER